MRRPSPSLPPSLCSRPPRSGPANAIYPHPFSRDLGSTSPLATIWDRRLPPPQPRSRFAPTTASVIWVCLREREAAADLASKLSLFVGLAFHIYYSGVKLIEAEGSSQSEVNPRRS
ncbi:hypothetical protein TIFTF001_013853 [Ficus carica]|uniref:Uncharacterized protein n=1 Tax=Ficus carica TaxID=3494 RepID=A0AA88D3F0_FICCA|nr:hypothetical protein TIFTF001_013853 [Ficus carica]